jgi:hypothetical protein
LDSVAIFKDKHGVSLVLSSESRLPEQYQSL